MAQEHLSYVIYERFRSQCSAYVCLFGQCLRLCRCQYHSFALTISAFHFSDWKWLCSLNVAILIQYLFFLLHWMSFTTRILLSNIFHMNLIEFNIIRFFNNCSPYNPVCLVCVWFCDGSFWKFVRLSFPCPFRGLGGLCFRIMAFPLDLHF